MRTSWGYWKLDQENMALYHARKDSGEYWIELDRCNTSAQLLDWIYQIKAKNWCINQDIYDLLTAFDDMANCVQSKYCSMGHDIAADNNFSLVDSLKAKLEWEAQHE